MRKLQAGIIAASAAFFSLTSYAANFSAAQIAQFKQLPQSQQQTLAKEYGVDLSSLTGGSSQSDTQDVIHQQTIMPRNVDANSNPQPNNQNDQSKKPGELIDFGYDLFAGQPSSYTPVDDLPVPNNYLIAPGDEIDIQLFGSKNESYQLEVHRDGSIQFPELGPIHVAGLTFSELKSNLNNRIKKQILGVDTSISLGSLRTMQVYVSGDVYKPGAYNIPSLATVTQALIAAGGFRKTGSLRKIVVRRNHKVIDRLDLYNLLLKGETKHDIRLQSGDTVFVESKGPDVSIDGQIRRPAVYEMKVGETLGELIKNAGGSKADAYLQQVEIKRFAEDGVHVLTADAENAQGLNVKLHPGDKVRLKQVSDQLKNSVIVRGAVTRQGAYAFHQGMKISDLFTSGADDLLENTDQSYALIVRETDAQHHIKVLQFNLGAALKGGQNTQDLTLDNKDQVFVFSNNLDTKAWQEPKQPLRHDNQNGNFGNSYVNNQNYNGQSQSYNNQSQYYSNNSNQSQTNGMQPNSQQQNGQTNTQSQTNANSQSQNAGYTAAAGQAVANNSSQSNTNNSQQQHQIDPTTGVQIVQNNNPQANLFTPNSDDQQDNGPYSRQVLLQPIIERLREQAVNGHAVQLYEITGSVPYPGTYPLVEGATAKDAIAAAGGLLESAAKDQAELTRAVVMPGKVSLNHARFDLAKIMSGTGSNFTLQSKDSIEIQRKTNWTIDNTVEIQGEVSHPGTYTIGKGETIADLVARAGGLTQYAYPQGAIFSRAVLRAQEQQHMKMLSDNLRQEIASLTLRRQTSDAQYTTSPTDALKVVNDLNSTSAIGRLVINLPQILRGREDSDVMLENGDKLYIPPRRNTISVMGQVQMPSNFTFNSSKSVQQYIDLAGGEKKQADDDRVYVIRANGSVMLPNQSYWFMRSSKPLQPGDTIVVPIDSDYLDGLSSLSTATKILYQMGVAWKAVN
ncbi:SLBB domain-containing protein [Celerinatantimonas sp. MCCC 1A17872]|uniref:SLBB domain-containing protein n=1 Tax=Celerinatantimonas sp. MCCC 1A17872 TaxID=3177514 RepID=UPI0038CB53CE